jgi:cytochrome c556
MKKMIALLSIAIFATTILAFAAEEAKKELRPIQKAMLARSAWLAAMNNNLASKDYAAVSKDAKALSEQTKKFGGSLTNPLAKELTLAISSFAKEAAVAADKKDGKTVRIKLDGIKGKCGECHAKFRDKK